jgi:ribonuclease T2
MIFSLLLLAPLRLCVRPLFAVACLSLAAAASADEPGRFDYYLLSLSWLPQYCAESHRGDEEQCSRPYGFVVHGLWPQYERGFPSDCPAHGRVDDATIGHMLPLMPSRGLVIHEWRSHGACSGLDARRYFATVERAFNGVRIPETYRAAERYQTVNVPQLRRDFAAANPGMPEAAVAVECAGHYLKEVRVCLDRQLAPRACGVDVETRCGATATLRPAR